MEIGKQIKKYRNEIGISQDELAEKIFVSRQTISSWENSKSYPDLRSLLLLGSLFDVSLDNLIKGDLEKMKEKLWMKLKRIKNMVNVRIKNFC
jgi:transcriptional regulator with XRE-family HTH domain